MKLKELMRDPRAVEDGVWVSPIAERPEVRVRAKVRGPAYEKRLGAFRAQWSRLYGARNAPTEVIQRALADVTFEECIVAVEGIVDDEGLPVPLDDLKRICGTHEGQPLYTHILAALEMVEARRAADEDDAVGNSSPSSPGA